MIDEQHQEEPHVEEDEAPRVMLVRVSDDRLALPVRDVLEVLRARDTMPVPGTPPWVRGLLALRGALVPVADLARRGGIATDVPWLVVVERDGRRAALGVLAIDGVHPVEDGERPPLGHPRDTLPRRASVRLLPREVGTATTAGIPAAADVLDVGALFEELFEGE